MTSTYLQNGAFLILYASIFAFAEYLHHRGISVNITRKIAHIAGGVVTCALPLYTSPTFTIGIGIFFSIVLIVSKRVNFFSSVHSITEQSYGDILYVPTFTILAAIGYATHIMVFQGAVLIAALADGFGGLIGDHFGRTSYSITGKKSLEGSLVFFIITLLILTGYVSPIIPIPTHAIIGGAFAITMIEAALSYGWDNLGVPVGAAMLILYFL